MTTWTRIEDQDALEAARKLARGAYQHGLLNGTENLSGSTLKGAARRYGDRYKASREALLARMTDAGIAWHEEKGPRNARILVIGGVS